MNFVVHVIYGIILPIDFHIFQDGLKPPTSNLLMIKASKTGLTVRFMQDISIAFYSWTGAVHQSQSCQRLFLAV